MFCCNQGKRFLKKVCLFMAVLSTLILTTQLVSAVLCPFAFTTAHQCVMCETAIVCSFIAVMVTGRVVLVLGDCDHHVVQPSRR